MQFFTCDESAHHGREGGMPNTTPEEESEEFEEFEMEVVAVRKYTDR
jgi:hypothetical protein